ncbi:hypothetical protein NGUA25_01955 [Salmonella enterica]|nr:hypothetical protein NGUA25_01955 [Salmonella enterica]
MDPAPLGRLRHRRIHRGRQQHQQRPDAFAARRQGVTQHVGEQFPLGRKLTIDEFVERLQFRSHGFADRIECNHKA